MWRPLEKTERELLKEAAAFERNFPQFYRDASNTWTATEEAILAFYDSCIYLYGIFEADTFVGLLYFRRIAELHQEVHLDCKRGISKRVLLEAMCGVRDHRFELDTATCETWVLRQNRPLRVLLERAAFFRTGLEMRAGDSHGKVLRWQQMVVVR